MDSTIRTFAEYPLIAVAVPLGGGLLSGYLGNRGNMNWYESLRKPPGNPPRIAFPIVWPILYTTMGYASHLVCKTLVNATIVSDDEAFRARTSMFLYCAQLGLNFIWAPLFFNARNVKAAAYDSAALVAGIAGVVALWWPIYSPAAWLMTPYLAWCSYAFYLSAYIARDQSNQSVE